MKLTLVTAGIAAGLLLTTAACGGGGSSNDGDGGSSDVVDGGTFTMAIRSDPGNLDPQSSAQTVLFTMTQLAYDPLVSVDTESGEIQSGLAKEWKVDGTTVSLTLNDGITCADGSDLTAGGVVKNLDYVGDPKNKSPFLGVFYPVGAKAKADEAAGTVTITLAQPAPFVLNGLASLPIVCDQGLGDRDSLKQATDGSGPYELTEAVPGDHFTYQIRDGYTWGPNGATTDEKGLPDTVVMKVVENESTAANLLLSGDINAASILGPDAKRLEGQDLFSTDTTGLLGEQWYNHTDGHATSDPKVRMGLTQALDLEQLRGVLTSDQGSPATTLSVIEPSACPGDSASGHVPDQDVDAAEAAAPDGELTFLYDSSSGSGVAAAAELAVKQWEAAGYTVKAKSQTGAALNDTLFGTGDWDVAWIPLNVNSPDQLVPFLSGPGVADGGTNFSGIDNKDYDAGVKQATSQTGTESCPAWLEAESALFDAADLVAFANNNVKTYGSGAEFETPGQLIPTSIRMLAE